MSAKRIDLKRKNDESRTIVPKRVPPPIQQRLGHMKPGHHTRMASMSGIRS